MKRAVEIIEGEATPMRPTHDCPGALLPLTLTEFDVLRSGGEEFVTDRKDMSPSERRSARVKCVGRPVLRWESLGRTYYNALCASCVELEKAAREQARERARLRGER